MKKKDRVWGDLLVDRSRAEKDHGTGAWDVADVMGVLDKHNLFPQTQPTGQHIDLRRERELSNTFGWVINTLALVFTVIALVRQSWPWGRAAVVCWVQGGIIGAYEAALDADLDEQVQTAPGRQHVRSAP